MTSKKFIVKDFRGGYLNNDVSFIITQYIGVIGANESKSCIILKCSKLFKMLNIHKDMGYKYTLAQYNLEYNCGHHSHPIIVDHMLHKDRRNGNKLIVKYFKNNLSNYYCYGHYKYYSSEQGGFYNPKKNNTDLIELAKLML